MLQGKLALVTGSTSGIGLGIARALAAQGGGIVLNSFTDRDEDHALAADMAKEFGVKVVFEAADLTRPAEIESLARRCEAHGGVDVLVNNAGTQHTAPVDQFPVERWDAIIAINLSSAFHTIRAALPIMRKAGWGRIINVASTHGLVASGEKTAYVAAKHGVVGLTKAVAIECADTGVTCNAICPGWVLTPLVQKQIDARAAAAGIAPEEAKKRLIGEKQPQLQFTSPEQLGAFAVFLCSPAASNMQGAQLVSDGGWTAQ